MKKMMIIAVLVSGMLMPAQIMAQNNQRNNRKPVAVQQEKRGKENRKDFQVNKKRPQAMHNQMNNHKPDCKPIHKPMHKPEPRPVVVHKHQPAPPPVIVHKPEPRPVVVHKHHCNNDVANVAAVAVGVVGLISLLAD